MLIYKRSNSSEVVGYSYLDFAICLENRKSIFGYLFLLAERAVSWKSVKQSIIVASTMKAEFVACFKATIHALWLQDFISRLGIINTISKLLSIISSEDVAVVRSH